MIWRGSSVQGKRVVFARGTCRGRVVGPVGVQTGCYFEKPCRYAYRIAGLRPSVSPGVVVVRAARPGEWYCGGPCPR